MRVVRALVPFVLAIAGLRPAAPLARQPEATGLLIRGGRVVDGTGAPARAADVRVRGDAIAEIGTSLAPAPGERVIDAAGLVVAPGFIDMHSHADRGLEDDPAAESQIRQGITTAIVGQDGGGALPVARLFETVERVRPSINVATLVGHGAVRSVVLGGDFRRAATPQELEVMQALVDRGMRDGALGLSSGLEYDPGFYATTDEVVELARVAARHGGYYASHVRDEENRVLDAWREALEVGRRAGLRVDISHAKLASSKVWGRAREALALLDEASRAGLRVVADWYPYTYWQSSLYVVIPDRDFENRDKWRVGFEEIGGAQNVLVIGYRPDPSLNGRTLAEIAAARGTDPVTTAIELIRTAGPNIGVIGTSMIEEDLEALVRHPLVLVCSDGGLSGRHPRGYGAFPRVLARYVRERQVLSLEGAVAKMSGRSAEFAGLADRGVLAPGRKADIVVFDPATIADRGTPQDPAQSPVGIRYVVVNGQVVLDDGVMTSARPGRALRRR
ncbi:MAG TPA: D-aminoacylase [Vicinamibacterales bacterium]|nr:D-aminoacylase [Vicinamibacterales bacterium]